MIERASGMPEVGSGYLMEIVLTYIPKHDLWGIYIKYLLAVFACTLVASVSLAFR